MRNQKLDELENWKKAGTIAGKVRNELRDLVEPGTSLLEICEKGEKRIRELGGEPAFPINVGTNEIAAHYTSPPREKRKLSQGIVKIDVGAQKNGYIGDTAVTVPIGKPTKRITEAISAVDKILEFAIAGIEDGTPVKEISKRIQNKSHELGFGVVKDLNGHQIKRWKLHADITVSNVPSYFQRREVKAGMILAIEPFIIFGGKDGKTFARRDLIPIYSLKKNISSSSFIENIKKRFADLPFAVRWLVNEQSREETLKKLSKFVREGFLEVYPVLEESGGQMVFQKEHTIFVKENSAEILTKLG